MHMERIKIVRLLTRMNIGGPAIHAACLSNHLDPQRFTTCLIIGTPDPEEGELRELIDTDQARLIQLSTLHRALHPFRDFVSWIRILGILWKERPRLIHTHMAKTGTLGRLAGLCYNAFGPGRKVEHRAKLIHTFHGHVLEGYFSHKMSQGFLAIERLLAAKTDCLIAVSQQTMDELLAKGIGRRNQWRVIPVGLDLSLLSQLPLPENSKHVRCGIVGRLVPIKNHRLFLEAVERIHLQLPDIPLSRVLIVGDGSLRADLEREVEQRKLGSLVQFTGWQRDLLAVYQNMDMVCLTSWNEGTPVALIEAMAAGRAVVATDVGGVREVLDGRDLPSDILPGTFQRTSSGLLVRSQDPEGLALALTTLIHDALLRKELGERARVRVLERFAQNRLLEDITALYETLISPKMQSAPCPIPQEAEFACSRIPHYNQRMGAEKREGGSDG